jgi:tetratricopeptide (TPR) repeat protein
VLLAVSAALVIAGSVATWRAIRTPGAFKSGDRIIVADFDNSTDRLEFDTAIRDAFEAMLSVSPFLRVVHGQRLTDMLTKSGETETSRLGRDLAERLCRDDDCAGYLIGSIEPEGSALRLEARIHRAGLQAPAAIQTAVAASEEDLLLTIHEMVLDLRRSLGEAPQAVSETLPPTTRSVRAYQLLALSMRLDDNEERVLVAKQALEIDPDFVDAYLRLGKAYANFGEFREFRKAAEEAYRRSSGLPKQARLMTEINFLAASFQLDKAVERLTTYRRLYPFDVEAANYLGVVYRAAFQDEISAETPFREAYRLHPSSRSVANLLNVLRLQGKADEIERLVEDFRSEGGTEKHAAYYLLYLYTMRGDPRGHPDALDQYIQEFDLTEADVIMFRILAFAQAGRLAEIERILPIAWRQARKTQNIVHMYELGLLEAWLRHRRDGLRPTLSADQIKPAREGLLFLPGLASWSLWMNVAGPLEEVIQEHERAEEGSTSRFVREELQFANGCLALIRGEVDRSRELLEPLAHNSNLLRRHDALGRVYEALAMWREAADEYEEVQRNPRAKWGDLDRILERGVSGWILERYHLAQVYEKLGDTDRARHWYGQFTEDWKEADSDIPELIDARKRLAELKGESRPTETAGQ